MSDGKCCSYYLQAWAFQIYNPSDIHGCCSSVISWSTRDIILPIGHSSR
ncbi:unnamed protein product, partial [Rotaria magnacalcarata]